MVMFGRNPPCPCGSGRKTKHCCGSSKGPAPSPAAAIHQQDERLGDDMLDFANRRFGRKWLAEPLAAYFEGLECAREDLQLFMPWVLHHWKVEGRTVRDWFLAEKGERLASDDRAWLLAQASTVLTVWEVRDVREGEGVAVQDLLGGETRFVHEVRGSAMLRLRAGVLGRVVDYAGLSVFCGVFPRTLPPAEVAEVVSEARRMLKVHGQWGSRELLASAGTELKLIHLWMDSVLELDLMPSRAPVLMNTDGDLMLLTTDHFTFAPKERERVLERLGKMEGAEREGERIPTDFVFLKEGNAMHKSWECTVIGRAQVDEAALRLETNSVERADALRTQVEEACAGLLTHRLREHSDPEGLYETQGEELAPQAPPEPEVQDPQLLAALREFKARHYADWLNSPLPALRGKSPREAVRSAAGRQEVDVMLKEFEHSEAKLAAEARMDFSGLRRQLGLTE